MFNKIKQDIEENCWVKSDTYVDYIDRRNKKRNEVKALFIDEFSRINFPEEYTAGVKVQQIPPSYEYSRNHSLFVEAVRRKFLAEENKRAKENGSKIKAHIHEDPDDAYPMPCDSEFDDDIEIDETLFDIDNNGESDE